MAYSRIEYLQSLNRMRNSYQTTGGNSGINTQDDSTNVGNELSSFAYMDTKIPAPNQASNSTESVEKAESTSVDRNWWQRTWDTIDSGLSNVSEGVTNFLDDVWDFSVTATSWLSGLFSGIWTGITEGDFEKGWNAGTEWTKPLIQFEWENYLNDTLNQANRLINFSAVMSGDAFTEDYWKDWGTIGTGKSIEQTHANSWANEWGEFGQGLQQFEQGVGYVLPSLVLAYFSGGASLGAQVAIQGAVGFASGVGSGMEKALNEGATLNEAYGYSAIKGGINAGLNMITTGVGGNIASKGGTSVAGKILDKTVDKTGSVFVGKIAEAGFRATTSAGQTAMLTAVEPFIQQITYDGEAIEKAYGSDEAVMNTLKTIGQNALQSAIVSAGVSAIRIGAQRIKAGSNEQFRQNYFDQRVAREVGATKEFKVIKDYNNKVKRIQSDFLNGKIDRNTFISQIEKLNAQHGEAMRSLNDKWSSYTENNGSVQLDGKNARNWAVATDKYGNMAQEVFRNSPEVAVAKMAKASGMTNEQTKEALVKLGFFKKDSGTFTNNSNTNININEETGKLMLTVNNGGNQSSSPVVITGGSPKLTPISGAEFNNALSVLAYNNLVGRNSIKNIDIKSKVLNIPELSGKTFNSSSNVTISKEVSSKILNKVNSKDIQNFLSKGITDKGENNYVMSVGNKYVVVEPFSDNGVEKYGIITIDSKTNAVLDIGVNNKEPMAIKFSIVPKNEEIKNTETAIKVSVANNKIVYDENGSNYLDVKNVIKQRELLPEHVIKKFDIPSSLKKTIKAEINSKVPDNLIKYLCKQSGLSEAKVVTKLGYQAIIGNDNSIIGENLLSRVKKAEVRTNGQQLENNKDIKLQGFDQKSGREIVRGIQENNGQIFTRKNLGGLPEEVKLGKTTYLPYINQNKLPKNIISLQQKAVNVYKAKSVSFALSNGQLDKDLEEFTNVKTGEITILVDQTKGIPNEVLVLHGLGHIHEYKYPAYYVTYKNEIANYLHFIQNKNFDERTPYEELCINRVLVAEKNGEDPLSELTNDIISGRLNYGVDSAFAPKEMQELKDKYWSKFEEESSDIVRGYTDNQHNNLSFDVIEFFENSKVRDYFNNRKLKVTYNANMADFSTFDMDKIGQGLGSRFGWGIYFDGQKEWSTLENSKSYYLNIEKPMFFDKKTLTISDVENVLNALKKDYNIEFNNIFEKKSVTSDKEKTIYEFAISNANNAKELFAEAKNDVQIFKTLMSIAYGNITPKEFLNIFEKQTGRDGIICWKTDEGQQFVIFKPNQAKSILNLSPSKDNDDYYFSKNTKIDIAGDKKKTTIGLAVTYDEDITSDTFAEKITKYKPKVEKRLTPLAKAFGVDFKIGEAIGGWTFTDKGSNNVMIGGEPSFPITITGYKNIDDVKLLASILADTAYEVQNSVGVIEYDKNGGDIEDTFYLTRVDDGLNEVIKKSNLEGYTLYKEDKKLVVVGAKNDIIYSLLTELENGGYLNAQKHEAEHCNANWLGIRERADLYQVWLKDAVGQKDGLLSRYVSKAQKINKYMIDHLAKDKEGNDYRISGTENNASRILKLLDTDKGNNRPTYKELIKNSANLKHTKVYDVKTTNQIVENALTNMLDKFSNAIKITIPTGKNNLKNFTFEELNLAKNMDLAVENVAKQIESAVVTFDNGVNGNVKIELSKLGYTEDLTKAIRGLLAHKGDLSAKSKWVQKYMNTLRRYAGYVHERAQLTSEYITAIKAQKTLSKYFEDTTKMKIGGNIVVDEINLYKKLITGFLLSKSEKNIAPSTFTKFVNNYNELTSTFEGYKDPIIGAHVQNLQASFVNGKFPDREPTLSEMQDFNMARARILARARELVSEKHQQKIRSVANSVKLASVALKAVKPNRYGKISQTIDSVVSLPIMVRGWFGYDNKITDAFNHDYLITSSKYYGISHSYTKLVFETLAKEAGYKNTSALTKDFGKKIPVTFNDRNGKPMKITNGQAFTAYLYYLTEHDQLVNTGAEIKDRKNQTLADFKFGEEDYEKMFEAMSPTTKKYADIIFKQFMNGKLRDDRNELYKEFYGVENAFTSDTYARVYRVGQTNSGVANTDFHSGVLNIFKQAFTKERVNSKNHFLVKDGVEYLTNVIEEQARWSTAQYVSEINDLLNTPIEGHTLEYFMKTNIPQWEKTWSPIMAKLVLGKPMADEKNGLLSMVTRAGITATLGFNPSTVLKQMLSDPAFMLDEKVTAKLWLKTLPKGLVNLFKTRSISKTLENNNGYFVERFENNDVIKSYLGGKKPNLLQKIFFWGMEKMDKLVITGHGYAIAQEYVKQEIRKGKYSFTVGSAEYDKEVTHILHGLTLLTQSNSDPMFMSRLRSGDAGYIEKNVFGLFASDSQDKIQALREITKEKINSSKRAQAYKQASEDENRSEEEREFFKNAYEKENYHYKKLYGKKIGGFLATIIIGGIGTVAINDFMKKLKGKKEWGEFNTQEMLTDVFLESTVNWLPYIGTIANAIENNSDVSAFTVDKLNNLVDTVKLVVSAFETKDEKTIKKAIVNLIQNGLQLSGIPAKNIYEILMGIWYQIDKEGSLTAQSWVKGYSSSYMKSKYTEYIANGEDELARAQLGAWSSLYGANIIDEDVLDEIVRLSKEGYNATPSASVDTYTNSVGEEIHFTEAQAKAFSNEYNKTSSKVSELLNVTDYKNADDETKSKMISKLFTVYRDSAKAKASGIAPNSKLAQLLYYTNGDIDMANYIAYLQRLSSIKEDETHTRKENVVTEINNIKGLTKQEKLLLAYLSGYSVSDSNKVSLQNYLVRKGMKQKDVESFLK